MNDRKVSQEEYMYMCKSAMIDIYHIIEKYADVVTLQNLRNIFRMYADQYENRETTEIDDINKQTLAFKQIIQYSATKGLSYQLTTKLLKVFDSLEALRRYEGMFGHFKDD